MWHRVAQCFVASLCIIIAAVPVAAATVYANDEYAFVVTVPDALTLERDEPPAPDHGFRITLGLSRAISVFAEYDVLSEASAKIALRHWLSYDHWIGNAAIHPTRLAEMPAASAAVCRGKRCAYRLVAFRAESRAAVLYHLDLDTDPSHASRDRALFQTVCRGFALRPLP
jgi:hypothetical protein